MTLPMEVRTTHRRWLIASGVLVLAVCAAAWLLWPQPQSTSVTEVQPRPKIVKLTSNSLFTGNIYWGRYINEWSRKSELGVAYPFSRLHEFDRESYQNWIGGLECPLVAGLNLTSAQEEETLSFNCSPEYLPEAAKWYNVVTLANNHTDNQGVEGFAETKTHLDEQHIQYFGHYDPRALEDICDVISLTVVAHYSDESTVPLRLPVAFCGYHGVFRIPSEESLEVMERYSKVMPVIAMPHTGAEYKAEPDEIKTTLYRAMIDHGADMVIGDHPHWVQTTESYKGKLIVYSMGNFMFDQQGNLEVTRSAAIRLALEAIGNSDQLTAWTTLAGHCEAYHDTCLEEAEQQGLEHLDFTYKFAVVGSSDAGKITHRATEAEQAAILERLRWAQTMNQLESPQGKL